MTPLHVSIVRLPGAEDLELPGYATAGSAGMDLCAAIAAGEPLVLMPGARATVPAGIRIGLIEGYEAQIRSRSGLASRHGIAVLNSPGTVDWDYRGEIMVILINHGGQPFNVHRGDRIAQMVIAKVERVDWLLVDTGSLDRTERGDAGFGSTG